MAFRDRQWYIDSIENQKKVVDERRKEIDRNIESGDYSIAMSKCDDLKAALTTLNNLENTLADKGC